MTHAKFQNHKYNTEVIGVENRCVTLEFDPLTVTFMATGQHTKMFYPIDDLYHVSS